MGNIDVIEPTFSPVTLYKSIHQMEKGGRSIHYQLPENEQVLKKHERYKKRFRDENYIRKDNKRG